MFLRAERSRPSFPSISTAATQEEMEAKLPEVSCSTNTQSPGISLWTTPARPVVSCCPSRTFTAALTCGLSRTVAPPLAKSPRPAHLKGNVVARSRTVRPPAANRPSSVSKFDGKHKPISPVGSKGRLHADTTVCGHRVETEGARPRTPRKDPVLARRSGGGGSVVRGRHPVGTGSQCVLSLLVVYWLLLPGRTRIWRNSIQVKFGC